MRKYHLAGSMGLILCVGLAACSTSQDGEAELSQQTVQYQCTNQAQDDLQLKAQYTFQDQEPITARLVYNAQSIVLMHDASNKANMVGESFSGKGYTWTTGKFTYDDVGDVDGKMLVKMTAPATVGEGAPTTTILATNCEVD